MKNFAVLLFKLLFTIFRPVSDSSSPDISTVSIEILTQNRYLIKYESIRPQ